MGERGRPCKPPLLGNALKPPKGSLGAPNGEQTRLGAFATSWSPADVCMMRPGEL